ncbi:MAG: type II toxin-antitoxin system RelE/ParE family toxin [Spirochaetaceae bacterium]|nr:type II toxin-antitoxin system RelE/ParE family toxin [Spirochaetaceae bacterium]
MWEVEFTDEFGDWWDTLQEEDQKAIARSVNLLKNLGPNLKFPQSSSVVQSRHGNMRELRSQSQGDALRTFYAFDPRRVAILLVGGAKTSGDRFYDELVPKADKIYDQYLKELEAEKK